MFYDDIAETAEFIKEKIGGLKPVIGIILGSGLGQIIDIMEDKVEIPYAEIPHFPKSSIKGHADSFVFGKIHNVDCVVMNGRFHYYEGFTMKQLTFPIFVMKFLGVRNLIVTNACGAINTSFKPGDMMLITDFINTFGENPLIGENDDRLGTRFPDMSEPYSMEFINKAKKAAEQLNIDAKEGVYFYCPGPYFETKAEIRAFKVLGADVVGMSTVPETIAANYLGLKVLGISCITNMATGIRVGKHSHEEVLEIANKTSDTMAKWILKIIEQW